MIRTLLLMLSLIFTGSTWADNLQVNEIYETYMPANKLIPVLEPMLGPEDRITGFHNKLMVRAPQDRQDKILELLQEIDRPLRNLLISVRHTENLMRQHQNSAASVQYQDADQGVRIRKSSENTDEIVVYKGSSQNDKIQVQVVEQKNFSTRDDEKVAQVRVLEGQQGFIQVGEERPLVLLNPNGFGTNTTTRMVSDGLFVIPQIVKDRIRLELYTTNQRSKPGNRDAIHKTDAQSVLVVDPDVWTPFAGSSVNSQSTGNHGNAETHSTRRSNQGLELKVTILD